MSKVKGAGMTAAKNGEVKQERSTKAPPFITVMILCYNYGHLLGRALEACAEQAFQDFELVMINNGATDNTEEVYRNFCKAHPEIQTTYVLVEKNEGPMHGWNTGLEYARGEYVMFCDADDWMEPDCLARLAAKARETGVDRVTGQYREVQPDGSIVRERKFKECRPIPSVMLQGVMFRRSIIVQNEIRFPEKLFEKKFTEHDIWFVFRFAMFQKSPGVVVDQIIYNYYFNPCSMGVASYKENHEQMINYKMKLLIDHAAETIKSTNNKEIAAEIEYLLLRTVISYTLHQMDYLPWSGAKQIHDHTYSELKKILPDWNKNCFLWPFGNGYQLFESICTYVLIQLERIHAIWLFRMAAKVSRVFKFRR